MDSIRQNSYDLAVSFASEHRNYVEETVNACRTLGLSVFHSNDMGNDWWGKSYIKEQRKVYGSQTRFFVPFLSTEYLSKPIPMDEFSSAMMTAVKQGDGYILPVLIGNVQVPAELLHPHLHYLRAEDYTPEQLAEQLHMKVRGAQSKGQMPRDIGAVVQEAMKLRLPKIIPANFSKYRELEIVFEYLYAQFQDAAPQLEPLGFVCTVNRMQDRIPIRIERHGEVMYALDIYKGGNMADDKLHFGLDHHRGFSHGINGWAEPYFDRQTQRPMLRMMDFSVLGGLGSERELTKEDLFMALWERIVERLERR